MSKTVSKSLDDIVADVRVCYDEIALNDANFVGDQDESELDTIIRSKIDEGFEYVYGNASEECFENGEVTVINPDGTADEDGIYSIDLDTEISDGWSRILWAKLNTWPYVVNTFYNEDSNEAAAAYDKYCGATWERPVAILSHSADGRVLKLVRQKDETDESASMAYVPKFAAPTVTASTYSGMLYKAAVYYICGMLAATFGEKDREREFLEIAMGMIGVTNKK